MRIFSVYVLPVFCRSFSAPVGTLSGLDMPGRPILHSKHHAPVHNFDRSISVIAVSDAIWPQQNEKTCNCENYFRMASVDCNESAAESDVFKGNELERAAPYNTSSRQAFMLLQAI